ncbi:MAG: IS4 family transposase [Actinobacteria bacterium]|nr:IS4 family transposase [Actinomycetota bacterium]
MVDDLDSGHGAMFAIVLSWLNKYLPTNSNTARITTAALNGLALTRSGRDTPVDVLTWVITGRDDPCVAHDGSVGVSPEGWLPDRVSVGALTRAFPPELVDRVVAVTDTREQRRRLLPARLVAYFVLALWLFRGPNCGYGRVMVKLVDALYHRRRGQELLDGVLDPHGWVDAGEGRRWRPPNISSLARARTRLGADPLHMLFDEVAGPVGADDAAGVFCCGLRVVSMDGSTTDVPNSAENDDYFGRPSNATRAGAFPQVRWVVAAESGTGALIGASLGPYRVGEQTLARDLLATFDERMLVLADRNFLSHTLARDVLATGAHLLWRASSSFRLTPTEVLADGTYLAVLRPARKTDGEPITVRVIEYTVHSATPDGAEESSEVFALVTDLLDPEAFPAIDLACAYPMRWECETVIGHHKTDMGQGMAVLRSKTPETVAQEMWALFAVYQAIRTLIGAAVDAVGIPPDKISFPHVLAAATDSVTAGFPPSPG